MAGLFPLTALVAVLPLAVGNPYYLNVLNLTALNVLVVTGLNLLIGFAGQISLGHAAFFGLGAYLSGILSAGYGVPPWFALLAAVLLVCLVALAIGVPVLRLSGNYLVMATLGFNIIVTVLLVQMEDLTGGSSGFVGIPPLSVAGVALDNDFKFYWLAWGLALLGLIPARNLAHSHVGRGLRALHDSPQAARACGVPVASYKIRIFVLSAAYAAVAGALYAHSFGIVTPKTFDIFKSVELVTMCLVGGMGSLWGGLFGAAFLTPLPQLLHVFQEYQDLIFGGVLLLLLLFLPQGLVGRLEESLARRGLGGIHPPLEEPLPPDQARVVEEDAS
jgi:branched-chain amino acid transport system permease protein